MEIRNIASPISVSFSPTWGEVSAYDWGDLHTWGSLLVDRPDVISPDYDADAGSTYRRIYKWLKGLRFRQIYFQVLMHANGTSSDGPVRLASIIPFITAHETVVKKAS